MNVDEEMLSRLEALAIEAGEAIMEIYAEDFTPEYKDDYSPVTKADTAAETLIVAGLKELAPEIPAVAEEAFSAGHSPDISGGRFWLVDPLDGTHEFIDKNDESPSILPISTGSPLRCGSRTSAR